MPTRPPLRRTARLLLPLVVATLAASMTAVPTGTAAAAASPDGATPAGDRSLVTTLRTRADLALARAEDLFGDGPTADSRRRAAPAAGRRDATLVLRDLARLAGDLPTAAQRASAARILARPDDGADPEGDVDPKYDPASRVGSLCSKHFCVHWVEDGSTDAVHRDADGNVDTVPEWVKTTSATMEHVYGVEVGRLGYRAPRSDGGLGAIVGGAGQVVGEDRVDVYLADLGGRGIYGYCTSDQPDAENRRQVFGYCVLDNDYAHSQFRTHTPLQNLRVTAAHEFFHLVQFGYDWWEDLWLMEGTAAWMEDEVYDGVNDNRQYLVESPLSYPYIPLDYSAGDYQPYGSWIFWRFLSEWSRRGKAADPRVVRQVWEAAVGRTYSAAALSKVLRGRHTSFARAFAAFGTWTRDPGRYFTEGHAYRAAPLDGWFTLTQAHPSTGSHGTPLDHMSHSFIRFTPGPRLTRHSRLRVSVDMADTARGSSAHLVVHLRSGRVTVVPVHLGSHGNGTRTVGFRHGPVERVELDMVNASLRFRCNQGTAQSCQGTSKDDGLRASFRARVVR